MTRSQLIQRIAHKQSLLAGRDVELAVNVMLEHMTACLAGGGRIEIRGFGSFSLHYRRARAARNPKSGAPISLFDVVARSYLAAVMPDYRYRQTTVTMDVGGFEFRAAGRQPVEAGWRDAFPGWQPAEEKDAMAQALPVLTDGESARLGEPVVEDKETRPPPRYREGTLIEAMQNAWRFVEDEARRERLRKAKGIGTPATRAATITGLKAQGFLAAQGKHTVPTERGLALYAVLRRADPALVDPGVTAELECLLDDVVTGRQAMMGAIDAVCDSARRIIGHLTAGGNDEILPLGETLAGGGDRAPTAAMRKFAASIAKSKGIKPPRGYTRSAAVCRGFLEEHAPRRGARYDTRRNTEQAAPRATLARERGRGEPGRSRIGTKSPPSGARTQRKPPPTRSARAGTVPSPDAEPGTPLRIPYGNKELAIGLGARYGPTGWYAPPGVDLTRFRKRGPDYVRSSCSRLHTGTGTGFGPLTWRRAAHSDRFGARCTLPTAQSTRSIEQDELGT